MARFIIGVAEIDLFLGIEFERAVKVLGGIFGTKFKCECGRGERNPIEAPSVCLRL